jgi:hypothetical protein
VRREEFQYGLLLVVMQIVEALYHPVCFGALRAMCFPAEARDG